MRQPDIFRRSRLLAIVITWVFLIPSWSCAPIQTAVIVEPGVSFALAPGQTAEVKRADTRITFRQVREESRCPVDVTCVWAGDAKIEVVISRTGVPNDTRILSITPPNNETRAGSLRIRFVGLTPLPRQTDGNAPKNYLAEFVAEPL